MCLGVCMRMSGGEKDKDREIKIDVHKEINRLIGVRYLFFSRNDIIF